MDKRYQVFVSSTYDDLQDERQEVMQALLELDCIPSGMELFPAANEDQWTLIKKVIDDCDYYIVISAGRYGSFGPDGIGYTEMEYRYAVEQNKPTIAFLHKNPGKLAAERTEQTDDGKAKLEQFQKLLRQKHVKNWSNGPELGSVVSRSLIQLIKNNPAVGWVRADRVPDESAAQEILKLKREIERLERSVEATRKKAPPGTADLAQGSDKIELEYMFDVGRTYSDKQTYKDKISLSWNEIFSAIAPKMIDEAEEKILKSSINGLISRHEWPKHRNDDEFEGQPIKGFDIRDLDFDKIKVQLRALGLIEKSVRSRSVKDKGYYWTLTEYGDATMNKLLAIKRAGLFE